MFSSGPKYQKLSTNLRLSINRLKLLEKKKTELAVKARKEISEYLINGKEDRARIRVEHIVREDYLVEAMEIVEMYCDLLLARMGLIQTTKELDEGLEEPIASVIWAAPRLQGEVQELKVISDEFSKKYGKEFADSCRTNSLNNVNEKLMHKLAVQAPPKILIEKYLEEIAKTYNVPFEPDPGVIQADETLQAEGMLIDFSERKNNRGGGGGGGGNFAVPAGAVPPPIGFPQPHQAASYPAPPLPQVPPAGAYSAPEKPPLHNPNAAAQHKVDDIPDLPELPSVPLNSMPAGGASNDVNFDDLTKRFEALKKRK